MKKRVMLAHAAPLGENDIDDIMLLERLCFSCPWNVEQLQGAIKQRTFRVFGLKDETRLFAYLSFYHISDEMEILNLAVHPDWRRVGAASRLLFLVLQTCAKMGIKYGYLEVRRNNLAARRLYAKMGFDQVGVRKGYYPDTGEDALVMRRDLRRPVMNPAREQTAPK